MPQVQAFAEEADWKARVDAQGYIRLPKDQIKADKLHPPFLILTSNSEKNLPDAFLRRCAYYHIDFPTGDLLLKIVQANVKVNSTFLARMVPQAIAHFEDIRGMNLRKAPATAELIAWIEVLEEEGIDFHQKLEDASQLEALKEKIVHSYHLLAKNKEDQDKLIQNSAWLTNQLPR